MIELEVVDVGVDRSRGSADVNVFIDIGARFTLVADGSPLYSEEDFPIVELAVALSDWLGRGIDAGEDFEFDSMSTPEPGWVWVRWTRPGWRVGSLHQVRSDPVVRDTSEIRQAVESFIERVTLSVAREGHIDVRPYFRQR